MIRNITVVVELNGEKIPVLLSQREFARLEKTTRQERARMERDFAYWQTVRGRIDD